MNLLVMFRLPVSLLALNATLVPFLHWQCTDTLTHTYSLTEVWDVWRSFCWHWTVAHYQCETETRRWQQSFFLHHWENEGRRSRRPRHWASYNNIFIFHFLLSLFLLPQSRHVSLHLCVWWMCVHVHVCVWSLSKGHSVATSVLVTSLFPAEHSITDSFHPLMQPNNFCYIKSHQELTFLPVTPTNHPLLPLMTKNPAFSIDMKSLQTALMGFPVKICK